jgi:hypothetical protein
MKMLMMISKICRNRFENEDFLIHWIKLLGKLDLRLLKNEKKL